MGVGLKALILVSSLALALDSPLMDPNDPLRHVLEVCDLVISWCAEKTTTGFWNFTLTNKDRDYLRQAL